MKLDRKLLAYAAATAAGVTAASQSAEAEIKYTPGPMPFGVGGTVNINFDGAGAEEYQVGHQTGPNRVSLLKDNNKPGNSNYVISGSNTDPAALAAGTLIGPSSTFAGNYTVDLANPSGGTGNFTVDNTAGNPQYVGTQFQLTNGGPTYYGWIGVDVTNSTDVTGVVTGFAYDDTPDTGIAAGAVPEPAGLALLALGAPFLMRRKSRA